MRQSSVYEKILSLYNANRYPGWAYIHNGRQWAEFQQSLHTVRMVGYGCK